jgi:hypothetical protein
MQGGVGERLGVHAPQHGGQPKRRNYPLGKPQAAWLPPEQA